EHICETPVPGMCVLRINSEQEDYSGKILISNGDHIVGALTVTGRYQGYEAIRRLLTVASGNFAYLRVGKTDRVDVVANLNIPVRKVAHSAPNLPADVSALFDEKSLLDKVFSSGVEQQIAREPPRQSPTQPMQDPDREDDGPALAAVDEEESWSMLSGLAPADQPEPGYDDRSLMAEVTENRFRQAETAASLRPVGAVRKVSSPPAIVAFVAVLFAIELLAIVFWPQVVAFFRHPVR
ncbi:MAG: hypothetical protein ACRD3W_30625, partial [Terriglobales bacterium]